MPFSRLRRACRPAAGLATIALVSAPLPLAAQGRLDVHSTFAPNLHSIKPVDAFNQFPNVGVLLYVAGPNDVGQHVGIASGCTGTLIHERAVLVAGHCTAPVASGLPSFITAFVTFSPNALDRSAWRPVEKLVVHPSLPPCPPPDLCTFESLSSKILDIGLVYLREPERGIAPAKLAAPGTLELAKAKGARMIVPGYGFLASASGGPNGGIAPPMSDWDGLRRIKVSTFVEAVDDTWAKWSLPGVVCYVDSGAPTFVNLDARADRAQERIVAVASDGGWVCFSKDVRARVDTRAAQTWIQSAISEHLRGQR